MEVALGPVTRANVRPLCELRLAAGQDELVAPASFTIAEGHYEPGSLLRAIYADDEPVGVLLVETEGRVPLLVRFMITEGRQRGGSGRRAVELVCLELQQAGWPELEVSFVPVAGGAEAFWRRCGFADTGRATMQASRSSHAGSTPDRPRSSVAEDGDARRPATAQRLWLTTSTLCPSGSRTNAA